jgi:3-deoxy-7-phosphoheptulonate synthase
MLIVLKPDITPEAEQAVHGWIRRSGAAVHETTSAGRRALAALGNTADLDPAGLAALDGVESVRRISAPFKLASREFQPEDTRIRIGEVEIGGPEVVLMAGPCAVESEQQVMDTAGAVASAGARILRGGAFKPRSSPYAFQGLGEEGLRILRRAADRFGLLTVSEVIDAENLEMMLDYVDILQVGARNMQNFPLLRAVGKVARPVLLKRGFAATIDEWLMSAEYVMSGGNRDVIVCERGIRSFQQYTRNTLDLAAVPVVRQLSHLPIIVDPSHAVGVRDKIAPMARAAVAAGADGILIEVHCDPDTALCDGQQSLSPAEFGALADQLRDIARAVGRAIGGHDPRSPRDGSPAG